ncbi:MAG: hypothetical protein LUE99_18675 [Bacteroides sp.]|nr:hypothetical protein [Bacteroides sp.]
MLVNVRDAEQTIALPGTWKGHPATDAYTGVQMELGDTLAFAPYEYRILKY